MTEQAVVHGSPDSHWGPWQRTGLHWATMVGDIETVSALIQGGCAVDLQDRDGNTALHEASWHGFSHCVKMLIKAGASVNIKNKAGNIALHLASQNAYVQTARLLLLGGTNTNSKNNMDETCLHVAARYDHKDVVRLLISSQCSLTEKNERGDTALHVAAALNHKKTVQLLLAAGIDANIKNNAGRTALDKARDNDHKELSMLLASAPQVHHFLRGRTTKKQRERQSCQSVSRVEADQNQAKIVEQGSSLAAEDEPSIEQLQSTISFKTHLHLHYPEASLTTSPISNGRHRTRSREEMDKIWVEKKGKNETDNKQHLFKDSDDVSIQFGKTYQLYTLYRDKDDNVRQSSAIGCPCKPLFKKLESDLKAAQKEMRLQILDVQEQVTSRIGQMDRRNRHQIKVLDMLNQERVAAERRHKIYRIEQQATQGGEEATQAAVMGEVKRLCVSQLKDNNLHKTATNGHYYKLLPSPSVEQSLVDPDLEALPLLSVLSGESSTSLAKYVNVAPSKSDHDTCNREYFEMKADRSLDNYENTAQFPLPTTNGLQSSAEPSWQPVPVQDTNSSAVMPVRGDGSGSSSSTSNHSPRWIPPKQHSQEPRKHCQRLVKAGHSEGINRTLEFYINRPPEPSFTQERNNLHAVEVTQRFFETVSNQLELWYERKLLELERQTEQQAQKDKQDLLQRISTLEAELQKLKTNENTESSGQTLTDSTELGH